MRGVGSMSERPPKMIAIDHDDHYAKHVGRTEDGRQFFLTNPFEPAFAGRSGGEFIALYFFDDAGALVDAKIDELGPRATLDEERARQLYDQRLRELGRVSFERIQVRPFAVRRWNRDVRRSGDVSGRAQDRRVADVPVSRTGPWMCGRLAHANSSSSHFASFRSAVSKPSVNQP